MSLACLRSRRRSAPLISTPLVSRHAWVAVAAIRSAAERSNTRGRNTSRAARTPASIRSCSAQSPGVSAGVRPVSSATRAALDVFRPLVFERSAADLIAATATQAWRDTNGVEMGGALRRRLRKQAKDMLRPGRPVADLHGALEQVQEQREVWRAH